MFIAIDLIIAAVTVAVIYKAVKRGFVSSLFGLLSVIISLITAFIFHKELGIYLNDTYIHAAIEPKLVGFIKGTVEKEGDAILSEALPEGLLTLMKTFGIESENFFETLGNAPEMLAKTLAKELSLALSEAIAFGVLFLAVFLALSLLCLLLNLLAKIPVLKSFNTLLGLLLGIGEALVLGIIIAKLAVALCGVYGTITNDTALSGVVDQTYIAKFLLDICPW